MASWDPTLEMTRQALRTTMPVAKNWAYFDHAAVAPLPAPTRETLTRWANQACSAGITNWTSWAKEIEQTRAVAARLIGAHSREIALVPNTTSGIAIVAEGLDWEAGDQVITLADEFPSNLYPWLNLADRGVKTHRLPTHLGRIELDRLAAACNARTRLISVSWVGYATGYRQPLAEIAEIAHRHGALLLVDAIQGIGALPLDVSEVPIDFLAADGHKWMLGPEGAGIAYIRQAHLERLRPLGVGWNSVVHAFDFSRIELDLKPSAGRYEGGSQNMAGFLALGTSLRMLQDAGIDQIARAIIDLTDMACDQLLELGAQIHTHRQLGAGGHDPRSGIITFEIPGQNSQLIQRHCRRENVVISCRGGYLRISPHAYNNVEDVERLIVALNSYQE
jgi:selenocysteine lyase/cysteine desulfurase